MVSAFENFLRICSPDYINHVCLSERLAGLMDARNQHCRRIGAINESGGIQAIIAVATVVTVVAEIGEQCLPPAGTRFTVRKEGI